MAELDVLELLGHSTCQPLEFHLGSDLDLKALIRAPRAPKYAA
ncbi:Protein of unknown function [Pyronema omphalodes CBS 100304]|uniref:Uncharacterized protein n=1 Tax=Pyronema omphalodes (strain CBS 100304) TaxID=1076935 RepID=U4L1J2_PYROM|nr:Protein of unknown function [Pyronema omphalodes CBS 100304]